MEGNTTPHSSNEYDKSVRETIPLYEQFHTETIDFIKNYQKEPSRWLDTGSGTGYLIEKAYPFFKKTQFIACDPSKSMLEESKKRLRGMIQENIKWVDSVASEQLEDHVKEKVDVVTAILAHHYLTKEERTKATQNIYNLLNEEGIYITFENVYPASEKSVELGLKRWSNFQILSGRDEKEVFKHTKRFNQAYYPITLQDHLELLKETGFRTYDIFWYSYMQVGLYAIK